MKIIIAGAGAVGTHLAKLLSGEKQDIILMDENEEKLSKLDSNFDLMTVNASPTSISGLKNAGVAGADLFIGVMPEESRNMTACMLATNLGAKKTVARIDNYEYLLPKHKEFFSHLGVHSLIYPEMLAAKEIVDAIKMSWIRQWWEFCGGALVLIGTKMRETAEILNVPLHELGGRNIPFHIVAIKRGNETIIPFYRYNVAFILFHTSVAPHHDIHLYQTHQTFGEFRQTPALCKAKVIEVQIIARNDDGNYPGIFIKMPFVQTDIHIFVGYRLEKHLCRQADTGFLHTESGRDFEQGRSERAYPFGERLGFQVFYLIFGEGIAFPGKAAQSTDFLGSNDIILLHETVPFRKNGKDITIELYAQQYNHHAE